MTKVSLILCTRNRAERLEGALDAAAAAIDAAPATDVEIIVVDNGSTDATQAVLDGWQNRTGRSLTRLVEPTPGLSWARNRGIAAARHDIIAMTDDDCRLDLNYFRDLTHHFAQDKAPVLRGGKVELGDASDLPFTIKTDDERAAYTPPLHPGGFIHGCNIAAPRALFRQLGNFDVRFGAGGPYCAAEDTDLIWRAARAGFVVEYVPDMATKHFHGRKNIETIRTLQFQYEFGNGALLTKHWRGGRLLRRHMWWNFRNAIRELIGGPKFDRQLKLSHWFQLKANIAGMLAYLRRETFARAQRP